MRSVASSEACGVVNVARLWRGQGSAEPAPSGRRPWKRCRAWKRSRDGLPGVWGAERIDGDGGNLGDPPRPGGVRLCLVRGAAGAWRLITGKTGNGLLAGRESEAAVVLLEPAGQQNRR
jgi:hypothetical protein